MKQTIYILALLFTTTVFGQTKDRRAELNIQGRVKEISVSPDEKIWLVTAIGNIYYTENIVSNWHYGNPIFEKEEGDFGLNSPTLDRISFFNKDTAIITGYISGNEKSRKSGYYLTKDAGKTWKLLDYGGNAWIYDVFVDNKGNAWMGGSSGEIFFSDDYGQHWKKLNSPYNSYSRMHSIFMLNETDGISGALHNDIYITSNNWKSSKKIESPFDQKKYINDRGYGDKIEKVLIWNDFIVVNQSGFIHYTKAYKIDWQPFPMKVYDFELDKETNILFAITDSLKVITLSSPTEFELLTEQRLLSFPLDLQVINHSLFIVSNKYDVYKVNKNGVTYAIPYTTDKKIEEPRIVKEGKNLIWGINRNQIYLADKNNRDWYRENVLEFNVSDFMLLNDSIAILWDGIKDNYLYSLKDHIPQKYFPEFPLETFLDSPVKTFSINSGSQGCFHSANDEVKYDRVNDTTFATTTFSANECRNKKPSTFNNTASAVSLANILTTINLKPSAVPLLKDFQITEKDKQNYLELLEIRLKDKNFDFFSGKKQINKDFYCSVPSMLDTLDNSIIQNVLNQTEVGWSSISNWFTNSINKLTNQILTKTRYLCGMSISLHLNNKCQNYVIFHYFIAFFDVFLLPGIMAFCYRECKLYLFDNYNIIFHFFSFFVFLSIFLFIFAP